MPIEDGPMLNDEHITNSDATDMPSGWGARLKPYWATLIVFALTLAGTAGISIYEYRISDDRAVQAFQETMQSSGQNIIEKLRTYENALTTVRGFVDASESVTCAEWDTFFESSSLTKQYPGAYGFSYIRRVKPESVSDFLRASRKDIPQFEIHYPPNADQIGHTGDLYVVQYTAPDTNHSSLGLDLASKSANKRVYDLAARQNAVAMSRPMHLYQGARSEWGVVLAMPLYSQDPSLFSPEQREENVVGWVACPIGLNTFFQSEWDNAWDDYHISMYSSDNTASGTEVYTSKTKDSHTDTSCEYMVDTSFSFGGQMFVLSMCSKDSSVIVPDYAKANLALAVSGFFTVLLTGIVFASSRTGIGARRMALEMTLSLRERDAQHRILIERANAANVSKSGFLANMSHEIRTPLTAVLGYTEVLGDQLRDKASEKDLYRSLNCIQRSGEHLRSIVNDILDLSKIDAGKIDISSSRCCLPDLIREVVDTFRDRVQKKNLSIETCVESPIPEYLSTDGLRIRQILINLVGNAIKFTDSGSITISIRFADGKLAFTVRDTGIGIHPDTIDALFHPFEQADNSFTRRHEGTGLGLSISRKIARLMHGDIAVESKPGSGSAFTFWFPAKVEDDSPMVESISGLQISPEITETSRVERVCGRVLLVEDGVDNQRLISHFLRRAGLEVEIASNGKIALEMLEQDGAFDVVLMDMQMPVMDGYTAARTLRDQGNTIPIIALTAHAMQGDREKCINAGCSDYLTKPIDRNLIISKIAEYIGPETSPSQAA